MGELISITEATRRVGISKSTMLRRLRERPLKRYVDPKDERKRLIDWDEIQLMFAIRPEDEQPRNWKAAM